MKAKLNKSGKGWKLTFEDGKSMNFNWINIPNDWDNQDVEVERINGQPVLLKKGNDSLTKPDASKPEIKSNHFDKRRGFNRNENKSYGLSDSKGNSNKNNNNSTMKSAKSPYNFVPLNNTVIYPDEQEVFFDSYDEKRNTGYVEIKIENLTEIFIRGNKEFFLQINGKPLIPGSSLRGLIRNFVGIISYSKFGFFNDSRFFFRSFADKALKLRQLYNQEITKQTKVGILFCKGRNYVLVPSQLLGHIEDTRFVNTYDYDQRTNNWKVYTGAMPGNEKTRKRKNYIIEGKQINDTKNIPIKWESDLLKSYRDDITRNGLNVLEELKKDKYKKTGIPVFYQSSGNNITSIGNTKNYRLPYLKTVSQHLYDCHLQTPTHDENGEIEMYDLENLMFGKTAENPLSGRSIATRVFFEDLLCLNPDYEESYQPKILSSPKPTSFQLYLEQPDGVKTKPENLKHWNNTEAPIRGNKLYWHKVEDRGFQEIPGKPASKSHPYKIRPLKPGNQFVGRIRYENLTNIELGALLTALELPENCCHKIGLGKPYGLGTIKIKTELNNINKKEQYSKMLEDSGKWHLPLQLNVETGNYKKVFSNFICARLGFGDGNIWDIERLKEFKAMLTFDRKVCSSEKWLEEIRYMEMQKKEFREREVLDRPLSTFKKFSE